MSKKEFYSSLILSEISDFFAGIGNPGEPKNAEEMQLQLATRVSLLLSGPDEKEWQSPAAHDVLVERNRQLLIKGFSTQQDDTYIGGELAAAAISYIEPMEAENYWPADWYDNSFRPSDYRRNLVKAGALIIAEIERIDRQQEGINDEPYIPD